MRYCFFVTLPALICFQLPAWVNAAATSADSDCFVVRSYLGGPSAVSVLNRCDGLRQQLQLKWLGDSPIETWKPRCEIVIHATRASYLESVGRGGGQTSGSSLVKFDDDQISMRRIDVLTDPTGNLTALPHELTHVVLADRFGGRVPPRWADEGIALMADSLQKQMLHQRDCQYALQTGNHLRLVELTQLERISSRDEAAAFYGQSLSLARYLVQRDTPAEFVAFIEQAMKQGYDRALRQSYGIDGVIFLERQWLEHVALQF